MSSTSTPVYRRIVIVGLAVIPLLTLSACQAGGSGNLYGYDFSTARITYNITGSSVGTSEILIKGEKKVIHNNIVQTKLDGTKTSINNYLIQDGDKLYSLDQTQKIASSLKQPFYAELQKLAPQERPARMITEALRINSTPDNPAEAPKPEKTETIAGQVCDYYNTGTMTKTCLWEGIPLHTVTSLPDYGIQTETIATKIELNQPIADSEFAVPSDYKLTELN